MIAVLFVVDHLNKYGRAVSLDVDCVPFVVVEQIRVAYVDDFVVFGAIVHAFNAAIFQRDDKTRLVDELFERKKNAVSQASFESQRYVFC